jgi:hypothetical protein
MNNQFKPNPEMPTPLPPLNGKHPEDEFSQDAQLALARMTITNWALLSDELLAQMPLPAHYTVSMFRMAVLTHYGHIVDGCTPLEALPRAQSFIRMIESVGR